MALKPFDPGIINICFINVFCSCTKKNYYIPTDSYARKIFLYKTSIFYQYFIIRYSKGCVPMETKNKVSSEMLQIMKDIDKTKFALETAYSNFDNVTEPDLIDCYIYEVNSSLKRYKYLLEQAAKLNLPPEETNETKMVNTVTMPKIPGWSIDLPYSLLTGLFRK